MNLNRELWWQGSHAHLHTVTHTLSKLLNIITVIKYISLGAACVMSVEERQRMGSCYWHSNCAAWPLVLCDSWLRLNWQRDFGAPLADEVINPGSGAAHCPCRGTGKKPLKSPGRRWENYAMWCSRAAFSLDEGRTVDAHFQRIPALIG